MYRPLDKMQISFFDFNQLLGIHMNPKNRWIDLAHRIPWDVFKICRTVSQRLPECCETAAYGARLIDYPDKRSSFPMSGGIWNTWIST